MGVFPPEEARAPAARPPSSLSHACASPAPSGPQFPCRSWRSLGWATWKPSPPRPLSPRSGGVGAGPRRTLLMAFSARLAALYLSGWPWVLRQSVCREDTRRETRPAPSAPQAPRPAGQRPLTTTRPGRGYREVEAGPRRALPGQAAWVGTGSEHPKAPPLRSLVTSVQPGEAPQPLVLLCPEGPGGPAIPSGLDTARATRCLRELSGPRPRVSTCVCVHGACPSAPGAGSADTRRSREPLRAPFYARDNWPGARVGGGSGPGPRLGRGLGDTRSGACTAATRVREE